MVTHLNSWQSWFCLTLVNWQEALLSDLVNLYIPRWDVSSLTEQKSGWVSIWEIYSSISMLYARTLSAKISYPPRVTVSCYWSLNKEQSYDTKCRTGNRMVRNFARKKERQNVWRISLNILILHSVHLFGLKQDTCWNRKMPGSNVNGKRTVIRGLA